MADDILSDRRYPQFYEHCALFDSFRSSFGLQNYSYVDVFMFENNHPSVGIVELYCYLIQNCLI